MRAILVLALAGALTAGCKSSRSGDSANVSGSDDARRTTPARGAAGAGRSTPVHEPVGKVASVNPNLRFVVIDFAFNPLPQVDQPMNVYRNGQKVGEVRISSQSRNSIIAADLTAGEARVGDEIRP
jgi:hypothetical protein